MAVMDYGQTDMELSEHNYAFFLQSEGKNRTLPALQETLRDIQSMHSLTERYVRCNEALRTGIAFVKETFSASSRANIVSKNLEALRVDVLRHIGYASL